MTDTIVIDGDATVVVTTEETVHVIETSAPKGEQGDSGLTGRVITKLSITGNKAAGSTLSVVSSGVNYVKSQEDGNLLESSELFNAHIIVSIYLNGIYQNKGTQATWVSAYSFTLDTTLDNGDEIIIIS